MKRKEQEIRIGIAIMITISIVAIVLPNAAAFTVSGSVSNGTTGEMQENANVLVNYTDTNGASQKIIAQSNTLGQYSVLMNDNDLNFTVFAQNGVYKSPTIIFNLSEARTVRAIDLAVSFNPVVIKPLTDKPSNVINVGENATLNISVDPAGNGVACMQARPVIRTDLVSFVSGSQREGNFFNRNAQSFFGIGPESGNYSNIWWGLLLSNTTQVTAPGNFSTITVRGEKNSTSTLSFDNVIVCNKQTTQIKTVLTPINLTVTMWYDVVPDLKVTAGDYGKITYAIKMGWTIAQCPRCDVSGPLGVPDGLITTDDVNATKAHIYDTIVIYS